ncbi:MAG: hypothetical protein M1834_007552 [Cirrosporium novae-zelandiae]|nr:MAG: hypothetical protein M1834_007552 [Cirrosporium novae-zelandiae]
MQTTAGSSVLIGTTVSEDAHIVMLLRAAGAVLLGHANLSEWASMRASYYSEGYSSRGGQCRNPYNLAHHPGGSSCGSAGAVATNMCAFSLGTETDGSVIFPADRNGIVGIKATVGSISCDGIIPESSSLDAVGTFGRRVVDAAIALDVIYGNGQFAVFINLMLIEIVTQDEKVSHRERPSSKSIISAVSSREALNGATFGLPWKRVWETASKSHKHKLEYDILKMVVTRIREAGAEVIESVDFPSADEIIPPAGWDWDFETRKGHPEHSEFTVVKTEFYNGLKTYLAGLSTNPHHITSLEDIMRYNVDHTTHEGGIPGTHPAWPTGQDNFEKSMKSRGVEDETYRKALEYIRRKAREEGIDTAMSSEGRELDGLLVPIQAEDGVAVQVAAKAGIFILPCERETMA